MRENYDEVNYKMYDDENDEDYGYEEDEEETNDDEYYIPLRHIYPLNF